MNRDILGSCCIVLHGHLPWVHHPEHEDFLEEDWYFEAVVETYLPLLFILEDLARDRVPVRLSVGLTPPLLEMMRAPSLRRKLEAFLDRRVKLAETEATRLKGQPELANATQHYVSRFRQMREFHDAERGDLAGAFRRHFDAGHIECLASCATHAVLPVVATPEARRLQIRAGCELFRDVFGREPAGFWLPECAYAPGVDRDLADAGVRWVILETHAIKAAGPTPPAGIHRPITLPSGVVAFGRDQESSRQVWSSVVGYPGDPIYRELYRDVGFDAPYESVAPFLHADGIRRNLGVKYHAVTGKVELHEKNIWDPAAAKAQAREHARHFFDSRCEQVRNLHTTLGEAPVILSPYDFELFGHWWYEGPFFLEGLFREQHSRADAPMKFATPGELLRAPGTRPFAHPGLSTWGKNGYLEVWLNPDNAWVLRHQHELERRLIERVRANPMPSPRAARVLDQMTRELLLAQSSDWAFILTMKTSAHYAEQRAKEHVDRFLRLEAILDGSVAEDDTFLDDVETGDAIFPGIDHRMILGTIPTQARRRIGIPPPPSREA